MDGSHTFPIVLLIASFVAAVGAVIVAILLETSAFRRWRRLRRRAREDYLTVKFAPPGPVIHS